MYRKLLFGISFHGELQQQKKPLCALSSLFILQDQDTLTYYYFHIKSSFHHSTIII